MSVRIRRVVVAGVVAAAALAIPVAALASGSSPPSVKPSPVASKSASAVSKSAPSAMPSPVASKSALAASKSAAAGSGTRVSRSLTRPAAVAALASGLGVSTGAARHALQQIGATAARSPCLRGRQILRLLPGLPAARNRTGP